MPDPTANYASAAIDDVDAQMPDPLPDDLLRLYALLALTKGRETTLKDVHDAWAIWRQVSNRSHRSLLPFAELSRDVQEMGRPYMDAIHRAVPPASLAEPPGDCKCGFRAPELGPHPACPQHGEPAPEPTTGQRHAHQIIRSAISGIEFLTIAEMIEDDTDPELVDELIRSATVDVSWPYTPAAE
jgi:hypothetical protein